MFKSKILLCTVSAFFAVSLFAAQVYADVTLAPMDSGAPKTLEELKQTNIEEIAKLSRFDSRDYGVVTPVKDQGSSDLCWAYSSVNASETSILRNGLCSDISEVVLSPEKLGYFRHNRGADPLKNTLGEITENSSNWYNTSGNPEYGATIWSQWCGPVKQGVSADLNTVYANTAYRMVNAVHIENAKDRDAMKRAIAQYGAVTFSYNNLYERNYHNAKNETGSVAYPHACTIIGWDDSIPAEKFEPGGASQNGGWIIKNSYKTLPYFYLSYDCDSSTIFAFDYAPIDDYDYNYFYDSRESDFGLRVNGSHYAANVFEAKMGTDDAPEYIKAVNVAVNGKAVTCEAEVYTDLQEEQNIQDISNISPQKGKLSAKETAFFEHSGYYTIELNEPVKVDKGSYFSIVIKLSSQAGYTAVKLTLDNKLTYLNKDYWYKSRYAARIKAFTVCEENEQCVEHIWDSGTVTEVPSCDDNGNIVYSCNVCGDKKSEIIPALGHKWGGWEIINKPTFMDGGGAKRVCENDIMHSDSVILPALSDTAVWSVGSYIPPTETEEGIREYISEYGSVTVIVPKLPPSKFSIKYDDGTAVVSVPKAGKYCVIFALYKDGILKSIQISEEVFASADTKSVNCTYDIIPDSEVRVFLWNTIDDMIPLC
ncbi:MAG: C1 family peptidase [Clostridia bacterium]|nr:C1 family peptidase [Clostridia bacterium]